MSNIGSLILFFSIGLLIIAGMISINGFHSDTAASNDSSVRANGDLATSTATPVFTVLGYIGLAIAAIALLNSVKNI